MASGYLSSPRTASAPTSVRWVMVTRWVSSSSPRAVAGWPGRGIAQQIKPVAPLDADRLAACLRDLDSVKFEVRVRAKRDLEQMGEPIAATLERFLKGKPSLEVRKRVEEVLSSVTNLTRELRALEILERIGDDRAQAVLKALARGTPEARLTRDAQSALQRLSKRPGT